MQQRKKAAFLLWILPLVFIACKKDSSSSPSGPQQAVPKVKSEIYDEDSTFYTYDSKGRVTAIQYNSHEKDTYAYTDSSVVEDDYNPLDNHLANIVYSLDSKGLITGYTISGRPDLHFVYTYNSDGQVAKWFKIENQTDTLERTIYYYSHQNLDSSLYTRTGYAPNPTYYTEYYTDKPNVLNNDNYGMPWMGKSSKNLLKKRPNSTDGQGHIYYLTIDYQYDAQGRVSKENLDNGLGKSVKYFTYY